MKTTVDLPDDLLIQAKIHAGNNRTTLKEIIEVALRRELARDSQTARPRKVTIRWVVVPGDPPEGIDVSDRETWYKLMRGSQ